MRQSFRTTTAMHPSRWLSYVSLSVHPSLQQYCLSFPSENAQSSPSFDNNSQSHRLIWRQKYLIRPQKVPHLASKSASSGLKKCLIWPQKVPHLASKSASSGLKKCLTCLFEPLVLKIFSLSLFPSLFPSPVLLPNKSLSLWEIESQRKFLI